MNDPILPGATLGVIGGGQLGRMFTLAAKRMGYRVHVLCPEPDSPAAQVADHALEAPYDDLDAVHAFAKGVRAITYEFENLPVEAVAAAAQHAPVRPGPQALEVAQHRLREKKLVQNAGLPTAPFVEVTSREHLHQAIGQLGTPSVLKTVSWGYDGKGQFVIHNPSDVDQAWEQLGGQALLAERWVKLASELSVVVTRGLDGKVVCYDPIENRHERHILDLSILPADLPQSVASAAKQIAENLAVELAYVGVLCVEFFLTADGQLLVNELAPRPHNSGHLTIEACETSQFEQQVRALCGLPLGSVRMLQPAAAMANLLGDLWEDTQTELSEPNWVQALQHDGVKLHLYGKAQPRHGRKMGHLTAWGETRQQAVERVTSARASLLSHRASTSPMV